MQDKKSLKKILSIISSALGLIIIAWMALGFTLANLPFIFFLLLVSAGCGIASKKIKLDV